VIAGEPPPPYVADGNCSTSQLSTEQPPPATASSHKPVVKHTEERVHLIVEPVSDDGDFGEAYSRVSPVLANEQHAVRINDLLGVSIITFLCCSPLFGIVAVAFSCATRNALRRGAFVEARRRQRVAVAANACGILLGVIAALIFLSANVLEMNAFRRGALFWTNAAPNAVSDSVQPERG